MTQSTRDRGSGMNITESELLGLMYPSHIIKNKQIKDRLEKRIEELESSKKRPYSEKLEVIIDELQKILKG